LYDFLKILNYTANYHAANQGNDQAHNAELNSVANGTKDCILPA